jgi:hypothetical protein
MDLLQQTKFIDITSYDNIAFAVDSNNIYTFDLCQELTEGNHPSCWKTTEPAFKVKESLFLPESAVSGERAIIFLVMNGGRTAIFPMTPDEIEQHFDQSWRLTIGYFRFEAAGVGKVDNSKKRKKTADYILYNIVLRWRKDTDNKTFLCLEKRDPKAKMVFQEGRWVGDPNKVQFRFEKWLFQSLVSLKSRDSSKLFLWNSRNRTKFNMSIGLSNPRSTIPILNRTTILNMLDKNEEEHQSTMIPTRYHPKIGNKLPEGLPRAPIERRIDDVDLFIDDPAFQNRFHTTIEHAKLAEVIRSLPEIIRTEVVDAAGEKLSEDATDIIIGALSDRLFSSMEWKMGLPEQLKDAKITSDSVEVDIDQVVLTMFDMGSHTFLREELQCINRKFVEVHVQKFITLATPCFERIVEKLEELMKLGQSMLQELDWYLLSGTLTKDNRDHYRQMKEELKTVMNDVIPQSGLVQLEMQRINCEAEVLIEDLQNILTDEKHGRMEDLHKVITAHLAAERYYGEAEKTLKKLSERTCNDKGRHISMVELWKRELSIVYVQLETWKYIVYVEMLKARMEG